MNFFIRSWEGLKCSKGVSVVTYLLGIGIVVTITAAVLKDDIIPSLSAFHDVGVHYIVNLGKSGL